MLSSQKAIDLIHKFEGWDDPWIWPGSDSGITIGYGYDLGYEPFQKDWVGRINSVDFNHLSLAVGLKGEVAHQVAKSLKGIHIPIAIAEEVFNSVTLPRYEELTINTFPNSEKLPPDVFGALVSVVFNRGASLEGPRRIEMRSIFASLQSISFCQFCLMLVLRDVMTVL
jgi:GH24 family phage-related lysozyme (muramidase)